MRSVSTACSLGACAGTRNHSRRRAPSTRRLQAIRGVDGSDGVVDVARKGVETFLQRASKALPIMLGREDDVIFARGNAPQVVEKTGSGERTVELTRARVESLLKPDAGRDDIFQAAGQGLTGVPGDLVQVGWWDTRSRLEASPELELQALNDSSRAQLIGAVLLALKEALENIEENGGSLRELIKRVARVSANDWMRSMSLDVGAEERCARVVSLAGDAADEKIWQNGDVVEGSKVALYAGVLMYLARKSEVSDDKVDYVEVLQETTGFATREVDSVLEFFNSPMAAVCVSVLQDVVLNISDSVASAYVACARENRANIPVNGGIVRGEDTGAVVRVPPFRDALGIRLKSTRSLEKFRNEAAMRLWLERNYYDVRAMYEDWHKLWGMNENGELVSRKIYVCRQPELEKLKGLRLFVSMFLEVADVSIPLFKNALNNFSRIASWLLVTLIGAFELIICRLSADTLSRRAIAWIGVQRDQGERRSAKSCEIHVGCTRWSSSRKGNLSETKYNVRYSSSSLLSSSSSSSSLSSSDFSSSSSGPFSSPSISSSSASLSRLDFFEAGSASSVSSGLVNPSSSTHPC
ncbi:hypothetical protein BE221DRAFT_205744 [Ostreococcus tauri]|uniref:Uncharacterized protein n=1 Tax=Ostreococcus tauri TaxID=70448 RepID=A0A1Y5IGL9_OSTTA|nr:hypothetical protein BE221DRAFT_205744 [Ostreococcus tauri]